MFRVVSLFGLLGSIAAFAQEAVAHGSSSASWALPFAIGIGIAVAAAGGAIAQGKIASAFMDGVSRNPGAQKLMFVPLILSLALVETLVLFTFLVVNGLTGKF